MQLSGQLSFHKPFSYRMVFPKSTAFLAERIAELGIEQRTLPTGCTGLVQPVDCGVGKPFKHRIKEQWWNSIVDDQDEDSSVLINTTREQVAKWVWESWDEIPAAMIKNAWRKTNLSYFPDEALIIDDNNNHDNNEND